MPILRVSALSLWVLLASAAAIAGNGDDGPARGLPVGPDSVIGENNLEDVETVKGSVFYNMAKPVARVENYSRDGFCTAIRVGETLFLTNYHCWEAVGCRVRFRMGYERRLPDVEQALFECTAVVTKAEELDFALLRVHPLYPEQAFYPAATLSKAPLVLGQALVTAGHPVLQRKKIDVSPGCEVTRADPYVHDGVLSMQHQCDTQGGSSGSPLFDRETGHVVGLHWGGEDRTGSNHGVPMTLILERIHERAPLAYTELTVADD